jgi:hypothetical protein
MDLAVANALRHHSVGSRECGCSARYLYRSTPRFMTTSSLKGSLPLKLSPYRVAAYVPNSLTIELHVKNDTKLPLDVTSENVDVLIHGRPHPDKQVILPPCYFWRLYTDYPASTGRKSSWGNCIERYSRYARLRMPLRRSLLMATRKMMTPSLRLGKWSRQTPILMRRICAMHSTD